MPTLRSVDLSECLHVSGTEIVKGLKGSGAGGAQLECLNLKSCTYIRVSSSVAPQKFSPKGNCANEPSCLLLPGQDFAVFSFTQLLGDSLRELDLTLCVNVTDLSVRSIATYLQRLVVLRLGWCKEITDWGLLGMVETTICEPDQDVVRPAAPELPSGSAPGPVFHLESRSMQAEGPVMFLVPPGGHRTNVGRVFVFFVPRVSHLTHFSEQHEVPRRSMQLLPFVTSQRTFPMRVLVCVL